MPDNRTLKRVLFGRWKVATQGRPRKRWVDDILKWCDMTLQQASHHAQDRTTWRNLIAGPYGSSTTGQEEEEEEDCILIAYSVVNKRSRYVPANSALHLKVDHHDS